MSRFTVPAPVAVAFWFGTALAVLTYTVKAYVETADGSLGGVTVAPGANVDQQGRQTGRAVGRGDVPPLLPLDELQGQQGDSIAGAIGSDTSVPPLLPLDQLGR